MEKEKNIAQDKICWEALAKQDLEKFAKKNFMKPGDVTQFIFDAARESCPFNFFGCNDEEGEHLAVEYSEVEKIIGKNPHCEEICKNGYCAFINKLAYAVGRKVQEETL